jgi:hypothetical protein
VKCIVIRTLQTLARRWRPGLSSERPTATELDSSRRSGVLARSESATKAGPGDRSSRADVIATPGPRRKPVNAVDRRHPAGRAGPMTSSKNVSCKGFVRLTAAVRRADGRAMVRRRKVMTTPPDPSTNAGALMSTVPTLLTTTPPRRTLPWRRATDPISALPVQADQQLDGTGLTRSAWWRGATAYQHGGVRLATAVGVSVGLPARPPPPSRRRPPGGGRVAAGVRVEVFAGWEFSHNRPGRPRPARRYLPLPWSDDVLPSGWSGAGGDRATS